MKNIKFSIRFSILSISLTLVLGVAVFIFGINYFTLDNILISTTEDSIENASSKISEQVSRYLQPLNRFSYSGASLIANNVVVPEPANNFSNFANFLNSIVSDETAISSAFWADDIGNFYLLKKSDNGQLTNINIIAGASGTKSIESIYDANMKLIGSRETTGSAFDARLRPWYQQARFKKHPAWFIYPLGLAGTQKYELGVTATYPIYDNNQKLRGVFGMDIPLGAISTFVEKIKITDNSVIFVCDEQGHLLTAYSSRVSLVEGYKMPMLDELKMDWIKHSFNIYRQKYNRTFIYNYADKKYIASYEKIPGLKSEYAWIIGIVTPYEDIIAPLQRNIFISFFFVLVVLLVGIILSAVFSSRISKPIIKLAKDAELICLLKLNEIQGLYSRIKEIAYMADNFIKMKVALNSFQRYMPIALVKNLVSSGKVAEVGGETKEITLLFTDIENFTPVSENMSPQKVMQYLSEYFQAITRVIIATNGTVDKYIGDGAMAFWGAPIADPKHAFNACKATLQIRDALMQLNRKWKEEGNPQVATRVGINTGQVVVGNVGSDDRLSYTALGDMVNLTSRLENLNKSYDTYILVSENTYELVKGDFKFRLIDKVAVKGKTQGVYVYELLGEKGATPELHLEQYNNEFSKAFSLYEHGMWNEAQNLFMALAAQNPKDNLLQIFIERCRNFSTNPPANWIGIWVMDHK